MVVELVHLASDKVELLNLIKSAMDLQPSDFVLAQEQQGLIQVVVYINSQSYRVDQEGKPVMCQVSSEHQFSSAIREEIKFAVSRRNAEGKQRVPTRQDLCSLSNDSKRFSFGFDTDQPGVYKVLNTARY